MFKFRINSDHNWKAKWVEAYATGLYSGLSPIVPGTVGTMMGMLLYALCGLLIVDIGNRPALEAHYLPGIVFFVLSLLLFMPSVKAAYYMEKTLRQADPGRVVIDEILGYWISVAFLPFDLPTLILAFILFRVFDITKPWPIYQSQFWGQGWGVIIDDILAGVCANAVIQIFYRLF